MRMVIRRGRSVCVYIGRTSPNLFDVTETQENAIFFSLANDLQAYDCGDIVPMPHICLTRRTVIALLPF